MKTTRTRLTLGAAIACVLSFGTGALALPEVGAARPTLTLTDAWDRSLDLSTLTGKPVLVVYEDKDSATQNDALKRELAALAKGDKYKRSIALVAVADVSGYDYWPVKGFVKDAIKTESNKQNTVIYCDWNGSARERLALRRGQSNVVLFDKSGKVVFSAAGTLGAEQRKRLVALLKSQVGEG